MKKPVEIKLAIARATTFIEDRYDLAEGVLRSHSQTKEVMPRRDLSMYMVKKQGFTDYEIAKYYNREKPRRHRASVSRAIRRVEKSEKLMEEAAGLIHSFC